MKPSDITDGKTGSVFGVKVGAILTIFVVALLAADGQFAGINGWYRALEIAVVHLGAGGMTGFVVGASLAHSLGDTPAGAGLFGFIGMLPLYADVGILIMFPRIGLVPTIFFVIGVALIVGASSGIIFYHFLKATGI